MALLKWMYRRTGGEYIPQYITGVAFRAMRDIRSANLKLLIIAYIVDASKSTNFVSLRDLVKEDSLQISMKCIRNMKDC